MYPSTIYRVVVKAFITNDKNEVFVVKEAPGFWGLPGGGLDHGESPQECLMREFNEELGSDDISLNDLAYFKTIYLDRKDMWMTWLVYKAELNAHDFVFGDGVTDAQFKNIGEFEHSEDIFEKSIFEVAKSLR